SSLRLNGITAVCVGRQHMKNNAQLGADTDRWAPVIEYEGIYAVSTHGRVKRVVDAATGGHKAGHLMAVRTYRNQYKGYALSRDGKTRYILAHRLVAKAFLPRDPQRPEVNHKDGNRANNHLDNLEWCSRSENVAHARDVLKTARPASGERNGKTSLTLAEVRLMRRLHDTEGMRPVDIAKRLGRPYNQVQRSVKRVRWIHDD